MFVGHGGGRVDRFRRTSSAALAMARGRQADARSDGRCLFVPSSTFDHRYSPRCSYHDCVLSLHFRPNIYKKSRLIYCAAANRAEPRHRAWAPPSNFPRQLCTLGASFPPCATRSAGRRHFPERGSRTSGVHFARNTPRTLRDVSPGGRDRARGARSSHRRATLLRRLGGSHSEESTRRSGRSELQSPARIAPRTLSRRGEDLDGRRKAEGGGDDGSDHGGAPRPAASHLDRSF